MSGTLVKEGIAPHFSDETLHRACEAQAGANLARDVNDFSMYQIVMPVRKRKYQVNEAHERIDVGYATKKARLEEYHAHKMSQIREDAIKEKERHKKHLLVTLQKRKREVQKLITTKFQVVDCENREGNWFVKLKRKVEYSMSPEKIKEVLNQPLVIPKLPPERKHHARTRPNSRSRKRVAVPPSPFTNQRVHSPHQGQWLAGERSNVPVGADPIGDPTGLEATQHLRKWNGNRAYFWLPQ